MRYSSPGSFRAQTSFLRRQFLQDGDLPFTNVLTEEVIAQALTALGGLAQSDLFAAGHAVGFSGTGAECGSFLPRRCRPLAHPSSCTGTKSVLRRYRRLLPSQKASARIILRRRCAPHGTRLGCQGASAAYARNVTGRKPVQRVEYLRWRVRR